MNAHRVYVLSASVAVAAGCSLITTPRAEFSVPDSGAQLDGALRDAGDARVPESCDDPDSRCGPPVPAGWFGPVVVVTGSGDGEAPRCPSVAPTSEFTARSGLTAEPAECGCGCADPGEGAMGCSNVNISPSCTLSINHVSVPAGGCTTHASTASDAPWRGAESTFMALGECDPEPTVSIPPPRWSASHRACSFGEAVPCPGGLCAPTLADNERLCIFVDGDVSTCPAGFPLLLITAEGVDDGRGRSACACGPPEGTCDGYVQRVSACGSLALLYDTIPLGACATTIGPQDAGGVAGVFSPTGSCAPQPVSPTGTATLARVRTVCCEI